jgi:hypothetical protein
MRTSLNRRSFLSSGLAAGSAFALADLAFFQSLPPVSAAELQRSDVVMLRPEIEPLVRLIETTPKGELLEVIGKRIQDGLSYTELLAALQLAGVRNVEPRPSVGFKFHTVLVVNSTHLASLASPEEHRWLPIFWALDYFKSAAQRDVRERGDWTMAPVDESAVPPAHQAKAAFIDAMQNWDEAKADAAVAGLARSAGAHEVYEQFFRFGARDYRSIGHKAIFVANSYRTIQTIGWRHAEPILRSLAYALLMHDGNNPRDRDDDADRPWRRNQELVKTIRDDWRNGKLDSGATESFLETLRTGSSNDACDEVVKLLNDGVSPQSVWDAMFVAAGEMILQQPGIIPIHANTTSNALGYAYRTSANDETRRLMMLQNAAFLPYFRERMQGRGNVRDIRVDAFKAAETSDSADVKLEQLFDELGSNPVAAAEKTYAYLQGGGSPQEFLDAARVLIYRKSRDSHDYKFSSAVLEDYYHVSPKWRNAYLAANTQNLKNSRQQDSGIVGRTKAALG